MVDTTFVPSVTSIDAAWLNDINDFHNTTFNGAVTPQEAADALPTAIPSQQGVMSTIDKTKLDGIETGATAEQSAVEVPFTTTSNISATNVRDAIEEVNAQYNTVADMVAGVDIEAGERVSTLGYTTAGDGGDNQYLARATTGATDDGGSIIKSTGNVAIEFVGLFPNQYRSVKQWGAFGDNSTDDTVSMIAAFASMTIYSSMHVPAGRYYCDATIDMTGIQHITIYGDGLGVSIIKRTDGTFGDSILFSAVDPTLTTSAGLTLGCTLRDIQFFAEVEVTSGASVHLKNIQRFTYVNVYLRNYFKGIHTEGVRDSWFDNFECTSMSSTYWTALQPGSCHIHVGEPTDATRPNTEVWFTNFNCTTAGNDSGSGDETEDVEYSILVDGEMDGVWFADGHTFGGDNANLYCNGGGKTKFQGLRLDNVYLDQRCNRNIIFTGTASGNYRNFTFNNCRLFGGLVNNITVNAGTNAVDMVFSGGCEIGTNQGQGVQLADGEWSFNGCIFRQVNRSAAATSYAVQAATGTGRLTVQGCEFECSELTYGIWCLDTTVEYHLHDNYFRDQDGNMSDEIFFNANSLIGSCFGNKTSRSSAGNVAAAASVTMANIASDGYNLTGVTASVADIYPVWHERRITIKADSASQDLVNTGNIRNKLDATPVAIPAVDVGMYEYRSDTARWHEL